MIKTKKQINIQKHSLSKDRYKQKCVVMGRAFRPETKMREVIFLHLGEEGGGRKKGSERFGGRRREERLGPHHVAAAL